MKFYHIYWTNYLLNFINSTFSPFYIKIISLIFVYSKGGTAHMDWFDCLFRLPIVSNTWYLIPVPVETSNSEDSPRGLLQRSVLTHLYYLNASRQFHSESSALLAQLDWLAVNQTANDQWNRPSGVARESTGSISSCEINLQYVYVCKWIT